MERALFFILKKTTRFFSYVLFAIGAGAFIGAATGAHWHFFTCVLCLILGRVMLAEAKKEEAENGI